MKLKQYILIVLGALIAFGTSASAADDFASRVDLTPLESLSIQHRQTLKTFDSFARQTLSDITGKASIDGQPALFTILDIAFRPENYVDRDFIKIKNAALRQDFRLLESVSENEKERIAGEGLISLSFWATPPVQELVLELRSSAIFKEKAVQHLEGAASTLAAVQPLGPMFRIIPPATASEEDHIWHYLGEVGEWIETMKQQGGVPPAVMQAYGDRLQPLAGAGTAMLRLEDAWRNQDVKAVNQQITALAELLPQINPRVYPAQAKRNVELVYNRMAKLTIPGAAIYFAAFVCFVMSARAGVTGLRLWGLRLMVLAFLIHTIGIAIRWWLVGSIPIKNQFESVLFSAWFGAAVGLILEIWRSRGIFGAAASFVGWMSLIAIFAAPYVTGQQIGAEIGQVAGVLMSYWLYIHVTLVVASYALIGMSFMLGTWWLIRYYMNYGTFKRQPARQISSDAADFQSVAISPGGGVVMLGFAQTLGMMLFMPRSRVKPREALAARELPAESKAKNFLATLDLCNLVVLQLAFWVLGVGIVCGAIWADESWGRPWGWDPKETFALVTWIVYLIVVHVRVATQDKAWWTAILSIIGFMVMLFNWIGVNFFLVGLHSYA